MESVWRVSEGCLKGVWKVSRKFWKLSGWCLVGFWRLVPVVIFECQGLFRVTDFSTEVSSGWHFLVPRFVPGDRFWVPRFVPGDHFWVPRFVPGDHFWVPRLVPGDRFWVPISDFWYHWVPLYNISKVFPRWHYPFKGGDMGGGRRCRYIWWSKITYIYFQVTWFYCPFGVWYPKGNIKHHRKYFLIQIINETADLTDQGWQPKDDTMTGGGV